MFQSRTRESSYFNSDAPVLSGQVRQVSISYSRIFLFQQHCLRSTPACGCGFNLVLENLLISTKSPAAARPPTIPFQSRTRESSYFNFCGIEGLESGFWRFQSRTRESSYFNHFRGQDVHFRGNDVSISYSRIFLFQLSVTPPLIFISIHDVSISYSRIFLFQLNRRIQSSRRNTFQSRTRESSYFNHRWTAGGNCSRWQS